MADDREDLLARREIMLAYAKVVERPHELFDVVAGVSGGTTALHLAVAEAFDLSPFAAEAVLHLQVSRFSPHAAKSMRQELSNIERRLSELDIG